MNQIVLKEKKLVTENLQKTYNSYFFTIRSPLFSPFNSLNLFVHFQHEETNNTTDGYYLLKTYEQYSIGDAKESYYHKLKSKLLDKKIFKQNYIKKIASA